MGLAALPAELEATAWSSGTGEQTIQGLRHRDRPIWGVQYHPEVCHTQPRFLVVRHLAYIVVNLFD